MPESGAAGRRLLVGIGNMYRRDDAAGVLVARARAREAGPLITVFENIRDPLALIESWAECEVIMVDAARSGRRVGTVFCVDGLAAALPAETFAAPSTHHLGPVHVIELARTLDRLPYRLTIFGIEGSHFDHGTDISDPVRAGIEEAVGRIRDTWLSGDSTPAGLTTRQGGVGNAESGPVEAC